MTNHLKLSSQLISKAEDIAFQQPMLAKVKPGSALVRYTLALADSKARYAQLAVHQLTDMLHVMLLEYETTITPALEEAPITTSIRVRLWKLRQKIAAVASATHNLSAKSGKLRIELTPLLKENLDSMPTQLPALAKLTEEYRAQGDQLYNDADALLEQANMTLHSISHFVIPTDRTK